MRKRSTLFMILVFLILISCDTESTAPVFRDLSFQISDHFLEGYFVTSIAFDSKGIAWIGTFKQGLIKYDGHATVYDSQTSTLPDSIVMWDVAVDKNDNIWIGSDTGLIGFNRRDFTVFNTSNSPIAEDIVWSISVDQDNVLWLASCRFRQGGLMKFDGNNWTLYTPENSELPYNAIRDIVIDSRDNKWVAISETVNNASLIRISDDNWTRFDKSNMGFTAYYFGNLAVDALDNLYASVDYGLSSYFDMTRPNLIKFDGETWEIINPVDEDGEPLGYVGRINTDSSGNVWVAIHDGPGYVLAVYNGKRWFYNDSDFPVVSILEIAVDNKNKVWLGTGDGIYLIG
ncbi:MAG: hypothetical protein V3T99_03670 [Nitrososphaerales archaeon]